MDKCVEMFGRRIKELRNEKNLSLRQLEELLDVSKSSLGYYENCEREPTISVVKKVADYFDVDIAYLMGDSDVKRKHCDK